MSWEKAIRAKRLCRRVCKILRIKPSAGALQACESEPWRAITCYGAILRSYGRRAT